MAVKHYLVPLLVSVALLYIYKTDETRDPGVLTCNNDKLQLEDKVVLVTGANRGIGYQVAMEVGRRGARLVMGCRDPWAARQARERIVGATNNTRVSIIGLDLSRMKHVSTFVWNFKDKFEFDHVDVIINNAATAPDSNDRQESSEGLEKIMATNYFGPLHLTNSLFPLLSDDGIVINIIDAINETSQVDLDNINSDLSYDATSIYHKTKQYLHLITKEMASRFQETKPGVSVYSVYPCPVWTSLHRVHPLVPHQLTRWVLGLLAPVLGHAHTREAGRTVVWLAGGGAGGRDTGSTWHSCQVMTRDHGDVDTELLWTKSMDIISEALK